MYYIKRRNTKVKKLSKILIILFILLTIASLGIAYINKKPEEKVSITGKNAIAVQRLLEDKTTKEGTVNAENSQYDTIDEKSIILMEYCGDESYVVIPDKINNYEIKEIDARAFENCESLEMIKIPINIAENVKQINGFEKSEISLNDNYIIYTTTKEYTEEYLRYINLTEEEKSKMVVMPRKFKTSLKNIHQNEVQSLAGDELPPLLPTSYDLRNYININVENQGSFGTCYAYGTLKSVETYLSRKGYGTKNLSEIHAAVLSDQGYGGWFHVINNDYFKLGYGPVNEISGTYLTTSKINQRSDYISQAIYNFCAQENYTGSYSDLEVAKSKLLEYAPNYYIMGTKEFEYISGDMKQEDWYTSNVESNRSEIKQYIMNNGSLYAYIGSPSYQYCQTYNGRTVMCGTQESAYDSAHVISLIGWNDNFSASNFPASMGVTQNGAYLALNSWGSTWGQNGCFWISYQDYYVETDVAGITSVSETKVNLQNANITVDTCDYNGQAKTPTIRAFYGDEALLKNTDYTVVSYTNNINAGTGRVILEGTGRFTGRVEKEFTIRARDIKWCNQYLDSDNYIYDGTAKEPVVTVTDGATTLIQDIDYTVTYTNNINIGTATVTITGIGNYTGTATKTYTIVKNEIEVNAEDYNGIYNHAEHGITVNVIYPTSGYTIKYGNDENNCTLDECPKYIDAGTYTIYYKVSADNFDDKKGFATVTINEKDISTTEVSLESDQYIYDGVEKQPKVTINDDGITLIKDTDYTVTYSNNKNAGTSTVTITGIGNYNESTSKTFDIEKADPNYTVPSGLIAMYGSTLKDVSLPDNFTWEEDLDTPVGEEGENTFNCTYTPNDIQNYNIITGIDVTIKVSKALEASFKRYTTKIVENENKIYVSGISPEDTIQDLKNNIETNGKIKIYDAAGREITDETEKSKTGMKLEIYTASEKAEYTLVMMGDINGDGKVDGIDLLKLARYIVELDTNIKGEYLFASNVYPDERVNDIDLLKLARVLVELDSIY